MDLRDTIAISPPRPFLGERGSGGEGVELRVASLRFSVLSYFLKRVDAFITRIEGPETLGSDSFLPGGF